MPTGVSLSNAGLKIYRISFHKIRRQYITSKRGGKRDCVLYFVFLITRRGFKFVYGRWWKRAVFIFTDPGSYRFIPNSLKLSGPNGKVH